MEDDTCKSSLNQVWAAARSTSTIEFADVITSVRLVDVYECLLLGHGGAGGN